MKELRSFKKSKPNMEEQIRSQAESLSGKSEDELMSSLADAVSKGKEDGSFTPEKLNDFILKLSPMLSDEQKRKLSQVVEKIK